MSDLGPQALVAAFYEHFNHNEIEAALSLFSEDLETIDPGMGTVYGHEPFREYLHTLKRAVPDAHAVVDLSLLAGEMVIVQGRFVGTFTGPLTTPDGDLAPTGASVDLRFADFVTVRDQRLLTYHTYYDQLGFMTQLGLMGS